MINLEKYENTFMEAFGIEKDELAELVYQGVQEWDSVGHMELIATIEEAFDIMMDTDDIIDFNSFKKGKEIIAKYGIAF